MSVSLIVGLLPYWNWSCPIKSPIQMDKTEIGIWPQHLYIFGIISSNPLIIPHEIYEISLKISENCWKLVKLVSPTIPQHIYIFGIVLSSPLKFSEHFQKIVPKIGENWWKLVKLISPSIPQHICIFGNVSSSPLRFFEKILTNFLKFF